MTTYVYIPQSSQTEIIMQTILLYVLKLLFCRESWGLKWCPCTGSRGTRTLLFCEENYHRDCIYTYIYMFISVYIYIYIYIYVSRLHCIYIYTIYTYIIYMNIIYILHIIYMYYIYIHYIYIYIYIYM